MDLIRSIGSGFFLFGVGYWYSSLGLGLRVFGFCLGFGFKVLGFGFGLGA